jgi:hypothetical protein
VFRARGLQARSRGPHIQEGPRTRRRTVDETRKCGRRRAIAACLNHGGPSSPGWKRRLDRRDRPDQDPHAFDVPRARIPDRALGVVRMGPPKVLVKGGTGLLRCHTPDTHNPTLLQGTAGVPPGARTSSTSAV